MNFRPILIPFVIALSLSACASWFHKDTSVNKPADLLVLNPSITPKLVWDCKLGSKQPVPFTPVATLDGLYAITDLGELTRIDPATGKTVWVTKTKQVITAGVGASDSMEYIGTLKGELLAFNSAGKPTWHAQLSSPLVGQPKVAEGTIIARTIDGSIYALDSTSGAQKWHYQHLIPKLTLQAQASVVLYKGGVFAGYAGGKLVALSLDTGTVGWDVDVSIPHGSTDIERVNDVTSNPVVDDLEACTVNFNGHLACFAVRTGALMWEKNMSSTAGVAMDDNNVYVSDDSGSVYAYDKEHGASLWKQAALRDRKLTAPRRVGDYLVVGDYQGYLHFMSLSDGHFVARIATDGTAITAQPLDYKTGIIVQTAKGHVFRIELP